MDVETREVNGSAQRTKLVQRAKMRYVIDGIVVIVMGCLLYYGASWQIFRPYTDAAKYECYAAAFWNGVSSLGQFPHGQCAFISASHSSQDFSAGLQQAHVPLAFIQFVASQATNQPLHALPHEYPILTLLPFSLGLLAPHFWSQVAFAIGMLLIAALIYCALVRYRSRRAALVYAALLVAGCWATAAGRFDLFPSALTLFAVLCALKSRWNWAFFLLAVATLLKFYPILLLPPFFIALYKTENWRWRSWHAWRPVGVFVATCVLVVVASLLLSVEGTVAPLGYFGDRPVQVESLSSSLMWLASLVQPQKLQFAYTFGSLNVVSAGTTFVSTLMVVVLIVGLLYTFWLQWRGKMDLATATLLTLLLVMITGKVFSPQYLIWVVPLLAYVGEADWRWVATWGAIGLLTTWIYPAIYTMAPLLQVPYLPLFYPVVTVRNLLMLGSVLALLIYSARRQRAAKSIRS
ncbi:MAG TPA: glycosyltransferase 87 family protein [Ktedonobacteraceae bacterium]|jgi:hypothetical protein|nr:glycosyltransferase 87 family protein [Ktedonobacteraceae bacterium]